MIYVLKKQTRSSMPSFGQYVARVFHHQTVTNKEIEREISEMCTVTPHDVKAVLSALSAALKQHLQDGDIVKLADVGTLKLEIEGSPAPTPLDFDAHRHIRGVRLHFLPESENKRRKLYQGIRYEQWKG